MNRILSSMMLCIVWPSCLLGIKSQTVDCHLWHSERSKWRKHSIMKRCSSLFPIYYIYNASYNNHHHLVYFTWLIMLVDLCFHILFLFNPLNWSSPPFPNSLLYELVFFSIKFSLILLLCYQTQFSLFKY